jgi:hypothetical protein
MIAVLLLASTTKKAAGILPAAFPVEMAGIEPASEELDR